MGITNHYILLVIIVGSRHVPLHGTSIIYLQIQLFLPLLMQIAIYIITICRNGKHFHFSLDLSLVVSYQIVSKKRLEDHKLWML